MREILFRGKRIDSDEWVYGYVLKYEEEGVKKAVIFPIGTKEIIEVNVNTISQYTGLKDKNGVKIFEGNYIGWFGNKNKDDFFKYAEDGLLKKVNKYGEFSLSTAEVYNNGNLEVIGNIHDK